MDTFGGWLLGMATGLFLGVVLGLIKQQAEREHYHRHHDATGYPHLIWSRRLDRRMADDAKRSPHHHNIAT